MFEFAEDEFNHNRIIEESQARNMIGNQIVRIAEIGEGRENFGALFSR